MTIERPVAFSSVGFASVIWGHDALACDRSHFPHVGKVDKRNMDITYHYPPELFELLVDAIPRLSRSKRGILDFFHGAGVPRAFTQDISQRLQADKDSINRYAIARTILQRLNEKGEKTLGERREVLKRVVEFDSFSSCWPDDQLPAKGLVAEIRQLVNRKDSFTRMKLERDLEAEKRRAGHRLEVERRQQQAETVDNIRGQLNSLFSPNQDPHRRGKALEGVLNSLFKVHGILVREAFCLSGSEGEGIVEQIDGVVEIDGEIYLVEMKWLKQPVDPGDIGKHLASLFARSDARGIYISAAGYTPAAINNCRDALRDRVVVLCHLQEFVSVLERHDDLEKFLKAKIQAAIVDRNPYFQPLSV